MIRRCLPLAGALLLAAACGSGVQNVHAPTYVAWERAEALILAGQVASAQPTGGGEFQLLLRDGIEVVTSEPSAGELARTVERCGEPCAGTVVQGE